MARQARKTVIGGFVVGAVALAAVAILVFGSGKFFQKRLMLVMFFDGSITGLSIGSPVKFRGVRVGQVTKIAAVFDPKDVSITIPVYIEVDPKSLIVSGSEDAWSALSTNKFYEPLLEKGLKARLDIESLITGQLYINMDFYPDRATRLLGLDPRYPEIPTIPSLQDQILHGQFSRGAGEPARPRRAHPVDRDGDQASDGELEGDLGQSPKHLRASREDAVLEGRTVGGDGGELHRCHEKSWRFPRPDAFDAGFLPEGGRAERKRGVRLDENARGSRLRRSLRAFAGRLSRAPPRGCAEGKELTGMIHVRLAPLFACAMFFALAGCLGSSRPSRFYTLAPLQVRDGPASTATDATLAIGPVEIPDYVDRQQIVTRTGANELVVAEFDRWGSSLDNQITGSLVATLRDRLTSQQIAVAPWRSAILSGVGATYRAPVSVSRFDGIPGQSVVLQGRWELIAQSGGKEESLGVREATVTEPIDAPGYDALVAAMQRALVRFAQQMADSVIAAAQMAKAP